MEAALIGHMELTRTHQHLLRGLIALLIVLSLSSAWARGRQSPANEAAKFRRVERFAQRFDGFKAQAQGTLRGTQNNPKISEKVALAAIATIMYKTSMRVGSETYARRTPGEKTLPNGKVKKIRPSFGASSLRKDQVTVSGDKVRFQFWGKSGVRWDRTVQDADLARTVNMFMAQPGERLWQVPGKRGGLTQITESKVNGLFAQFGAKPKDMRTMLANQRLDTALSRTSRPTSLRQAEQTLTTAIEGVAKFMGHRPSTCRTSYLKPATLTQYTAGLE